MSVDWNKFDELAKDWVKGSLQAYWELILLLDGLGDEIAAELETPVGLLR